MKLDQNQYKIECIYNSEVGGIKLNLTINQYKHDKDIKVIEFHKSEGNIYNFHGKVKEIKDKFLKPLVLNYE